MMTTKDRKGPKAPKQPKTIERPPQSMTAPPKRLHIYTNKDVRSDINNLFIGLTIGYKKHFLGLEINNKFIGISLIFTHIVFSFKPQ
jgi:hypothetical protein